VIEIFVILLYSSPAFLSKVTVLGVDLLLLTLNPESLTTINIALPTLLSVPSPASLGVLTV